MVTLSKKQQELLIYLSKNKNKKIIDSDIEEFYKNRISAYRSLTHLKNQGYIRIIKDSIDKRKNVYYLSIKGTFLVFLLG